MTEIISWDRGESIRITNSYINGDSDSIDPDTIELKIYDPIGTLKTTVTYAASEIIKDSIGEYHYDYLIPADSNVGLWINKWIGIAGDFEDISKNHFNVADPLQKLYCTVEEVWNRAGIDSTVAVRNEVIPLIKDSMAEIDAMYAKSFQYDIEKTQWFDTNRADPAIKVTNVYLNYKPVISITSLEEYDTDGDLIKTYEAADYWINTNTGRITLLDTEFVKQIHRVKVVYTYGFVEVPQKISSLCAVLSAMRLLIHQIGGTYDDVTTYSAAGLSIGVGEPYMNMSKSVESLNKEATRLMNNIGRLRPSCFIL